jgi:phospholipid transport system transporter-binding protein
VASNAQLRQDGSTLHFSGVLDRDAVVALWPAARKAIGQVQQLDLQAVQRIDSAGLALLAELAEHLPDANTSLSGAPTGLAELRAAYRLSPTLHFDANPDAS